MFIKDWEHRRVKDSGDPDKRRSGTGSTSVMIVTGIIFPSLHASPYVCSHP